MNILLNHIIPIKIYKDKVEHSKSELYKLLSGIETNKKVFIPSWTNINYWYPKEMLEELSKYWGYLKNA